MASGTFSPMFGKILKVLSNEERASLKLDVRFTFVSRKSLLAQYPPNIPLPITTASKTAVNMASTKLLQNVSALLRRCSKKSLDNRPHPSDEGIKRGKPVAIIYGFQSDFLSLSTLDSLSS